MTRHLPLISPPRGRFVILPLMAGLACAPGAEQVDTTTDVESINRVREQEIRAFSSASTDSLLAVVAADAILMPPNEPAVTGHDAIRSWADGIYRQFNVSGRYTQSDVVIAGDWAIERYTGSLSLTPKAGGAGVSEDMKGIHIYRRQPDGSWLIVHDVWNTNTAPVAPR